MQLAFRAAPGPATSASGLRQRAAQATERRSRRKAERGYGPLAKLGSQGGPTGRSSGSQAGPTGRSSGSQRWQADGRSSGLWWESSQWGSWGDDWWQLDRS